MIRVAEGVYRLFAGITANQYLVVEPQGAALVDTGLRGSHRLILHSLLQLGMGPHDLRYIFLTHADPDHAGAALELQRRSGAPVVASRLEMEGLRFGRMTRSLLSTSFEGRVFRLVLPLFPVDPCAADACAEEGAVFPVLGGLEVVPTPGHTPGHSSFYSRSTGILFAGDSINCRGGRPLPYLGDSTADKDAARDSFERQMALQPKFICAGHSFCRMN